MSNFYLRKFRVLNISFIIIVLQLLPGPRSIGQPALNFNPLLTGLSSPVDIVNAGDGTNRLFIVEKTGQIRIYEGSALLASPFIDLTDSITSGGSEQGLLSLVFDPNYGTNRTFFVYYTRSSDGAVTIARFQTSLSNPDSADRSTGVILFTIPKPHGQTNHNGGKLNFGPDGYLYFGIGDGGGAGDADNLAQNGNALQGKILRINVNNVNAPPYYTIPPDNPFISSPTIRHEIWAMGLRNPWRWSFDRSTQDIWIADVGQNAWEEVNVIPAGTAGGLNFGWRCYEGINPFNTAGCQPLSSYTSPIFEYPHNNSTGGFAVTGGYVYRGTDFPAMAGYYITADYISGNVWKIKPNGSGGWNVSMQSGLPGNIVSFGEGENGALFAASLTGSLFSVQASAILPVTLLNFGATSDKGAVLLSWQTSYEQDLSRFVIEYSTDGNNFTPVGEVAATNAATGGAYSFRHIVLNASRIYYRLTMIDKDDNRDYSKIISTIVTGTAGNYIYPTFINSGMVSLYLNDPFNTVELLDLSGRLLLKQVIDGRTGRIDIRLPKAASGTVLVRVNGRGTSLLQKVLINH